MVVVGLMVTIACPAKYFMMWITVDKGQSTVHGATSLPDDHSAQQLVLLLNFPIV